MAVTQVYTAVPGDTITAARWNNEFGNIYNNGTAIAFPLTQGVSFAGQSITLDALGQTAFSSSSAKGFILTPGAKAGAVGTAGGSILHISAHTFTDTATAGSGTATAAVFNYFEQPTLAATNASVTTTDAATMYIANAPANGTNDTITNPWALWIDAGGLRTDGYLGGTVALGKHIYGLIQATGADTVNDIFMTVGGAVSDDAAAANKRLMTLTGTLEKRSDATWVVGDAQGMLDTGAVGNSDYYLFLIMRPDTGVVDMLCSLSSTAPTMPTSYTYKCCIGWFKRVGGTIVAFTAVETAGGGIKIKWTVPTLDVNIAATLTTSRRTDAVKVPLNLSTTAHLMVAFTEAASTSVGWIGDPAITDFAPTTTQSNMRCFVNAMSSVYQFDVVTSVTGTVASRANVATVDDYKIYTDGFTWSRR